MQSRLHSSAKRRTYRRNEHRIVMPLIYLLLAAPCVAILTTRPATVGVAILALILVGLLFLAYRTFTMTVSVSDEDVEVRNVFGTRWFGWDEIVRFDWGTQMGFPIGGVCLIDGRFVRATALTPPLNSGTDRAVPRALAGLNAELERHRGSAPAPLPEPTRNAGPGLGRRPVLRTTLMLLAVALPIIVIVTDNNWW